MGKVQVKIATLLTTQNTHDSIHSLFIPQQNSSGKKTR